MGSFIQFIGLETGNFDLGQNLTSFLPCHRHLEGSQMDVIHLSHFLLVPLNIAKKNIYLTLDHIQVPREKQQHWQDEVVDYLGCRMNNEEEEEEDQENGNKDVACDKI